MTKGSMHWFMAHHGITNDAGLAMVAKKVSQPRHVVNAIWFCILEYASKQSERGGVVGLDAEEIALTQELEEQQVIDVVEMLREREHLDEEKVISWSKYQKALDSTNAQRQQKYRDKKKAESKGVTLRNDSEALCNDKNRKEKNKENISKKEEGVVTNVKRKADAGKVKDMIYGFYQMLAEMHGEGVWELYGSTTAYTNYSEEQLGRMVSHFLDAKQHPTMPTKDEFFAYLDSEAEV